MESRRREALAIFASWYARELPKSQDVRSVLMEAAPRGARQYRLSSPNRGNGGTRLFPKGRAWSLSPFEFPCVICRGYYGIIWYGAIGELIEESGEVAIVSKLLIARCPSDTSKRFAD